MATDTVPPLLLDDVDDDTPRINLVFQGGGIRGIAYAAAYRAMRDKAPAIELQGVGGTSVGALVAALIAIGKDADAILEVFRQPDLYDVIEKSEARRFRRLRKTLARLARNLRASRASRWDVRLLQALWHPLANAVSLQRALLFTGRGLRRIWDSRGCFSSRRLIALVEALCEGKTFEDVLAMGHVKDLRIVAADVRRKRYRIFSCQEQDATCPIAYAVLAAMSTPGFFKPLEIDGECLVDGSVLSDAPRFLFAQNGYPTIGLRLDDLPAARDPEPAALSGRLAPASYVKSVLLTMMLGQDTLRETPRSGDGDPDAAERQRRQLDATTHFTGVTIETQPEDATFLDYRLTPRQLEVLEERGVAASARVDWSKAARPKRPSLYDPGAHVALANVMVATEELFEIYQEFRPEAIETETVYTVRVTQDWTSHYERLLTVKVSGRRPLVMTQHRIYGFKEPTTSLAEEAYRPVAREILGDRPVGQTVLPLSSEQDSKRYLVFYIPPVAEGDKPRTFWSSLTIPHEFHETLRRGLPDEVAYTAHQLGNAHDLVLKLRVAVDDRLPLPGIEPEIRPEETRSFVETNPLGCFRVTEFTYHETLDSAKRRFRVWLRPREDGSLP
jgi:predicted acylesterase/phospholipase RssA